MRALTPGVEFCGGAGNINNPEPTKEQQHCIFPVVKASCRTDLSIISALAWA